MNNRMNFRARGWLIGLIAVSAVHTQAAQVETPYTTVSRYNVGGQMTGTISPDPDGAGPIGYAATRYTYGTEGNSRALLIRVESGELASWANESVAPSNWSNFTAFVITQYTYDSYGRKATERVIGADLSVESLIQYSYDSRNRVHCKAVRMNPAAYDSLPPACTLGTEGAFGPDRIYRYTYDILDQVLTEERAVGTSLQQTYVTNTYDPIKTRLLTSQTDANGNRTELRYDSYARLSRRVYPSPSGAGAVNESDYNEYGYDLNGNLRTERKRNGTTILNTHDANNRLVYKDISDNTHSQDVSYDYDLRGLTLSSRFVNDNGQGITNTFDGFGRLSSTSTNVGGTTRLLKYRYDANGNRTRVTHDDGWFFEYDFDGLNRLNYLGESVGVAESANNSPLLSIDYHPGGGRYHLSRTGGAVTEYLQDNIARLDSFSQDFSGSANDLLATFDYNPASQVIYRFRSNDLYAITGQVSRIGVYVPNGLNQYTDIGGRAIGYDGNGNLTSYRDANDELVTYGYDMENHLVSASGTVNGQSVNASFIWDPLGRLHQVTINGTARQFLYDGDALVAEYNGTGLVRRFVHGDQVDEPLVLYDGASVGTSYRRFLHADHQGSVIAQSGSTGAVISTNAYDPYGIPAATNSGRFGYTGQAWLPELGLFHYKARIYHPRMGRFLQTDPIFYGDNMNLYAYVSGDPFNRVDPLGLWSTPAHNRLISSTFAGRLSPASVARIQAGSLWADKGPNQAGERSFMHSMSDKSAGQSPAEARALSTAYVNQALEIARTLVDQGKLEQAEFIFGAAMHTVMDGLSPEHTDAQGNPIPWSLSGFVPHGWGDSNLMGDFPGCNECRRDLTPRVMFGAGVAMYNAYVGVFGDPAKIPSVTIEECTEDSSCK